VVERNGRAREQAAKSLPVFRSRANASCVLGRATADLEFVGPCRPVNHRLKPSLVVLFAGEPVRTHERYVLSVKSWVRARDSARTNPCKHIGLPSTEFPWKPNLRVEMTDPPARPVANEPTVVADIRCKATSSRPGLCAVDALPVLWVDRG